MFKLEHNPIEWLKASGGKWKENLLLAANLLLKEYRVKWSHVVPINLNLLAFSLDTKIRVVSTLESEATISPGYRCFTIFLRGSTNSSRKRTKIAHELAHILFYNMHLDIPRRLIDENKKELREREEIFCYDLARYLLAPEWVIKEMFPEHRLKSMNHFKTFEYFVRTLQITKPLASRLILEDYSLTNGFCGYWKLKGNKWDLDGNKAFYSKNFKGRKNEVKKAVMDWLNHKKPIQNFPDYKLQCQDEFNRTKFTILLKKPL